MRRHHAVWCVLLACILLLTGCGKKSATQGIQGRVIDNANKAVAGATVMVAGLSDLVQTASDGSYTLPVPPGHYVVLATKQGYKAAGMVVGQGVNAQRTRVEVDVLPGQKTTAPDIVLVPDVYSVDTAVITQISPPVSTKLESGQSASVTVNVNYVLETEANGRLYVFVYTGRGASISQKSVSVSKGSGSQAFTLDFTVPYTTSLRVESILTTAGGRILSVNYQPAHSVTQKTAPQPPTLTLRKASLGGVQLAFSGGNAYDCAALELYRTYSTSVVKVTNIDPQQASYTDTTALEGIAYQYHLRLVTKDGNVFSSNSVTATVPRVGYSVVMEGANLASAVLVQDPAQNILYMADHTNKKMVAVNTDTFQEIRSVSLQDVPTVMTITADGSTIYGVAAGSAKALKIDTNSLLATTLATGLVNPNGVAVHPDGKTLYVSATDGLHAIKTADGSSVEKNALLKYPAPLAISDDGAYLFMFGPQVTAINPQTLIVEHGYPHYNYGDNNRPLLNNRYRELFFENEYVFEAKPAWRQLDRLGTAYAGSVDVIGFSKDGSLTYAVGYSPYSPQRHLAVYEKKGITWESIARFDIPEYTTIEDPFSTTGGQKVCGKGVPLDGSAVHLFCVDFAERKAAN